MHLCTQAFFRQPRRRILFFLFRQLAANARKQVLFFHLHHLCCFGERSGQQRWCEMDKLRCCAEEDRRRHNTTSNRRKAGKGACWRGHCTTPFKFSPRQDLKLRGKFKLGVGALLAPTAKSLRANRAGRGSRGQERKHDRR